LAGEELVIDSHPRRVEIAEPDQLPPVGGLAEDGRRIHVRANAQAYDRVSPACAHLCPTPRHPAISGGYGGAARRCRVTRVRSVGAPLEGPCRVPRARSPFASPARRSAPSAP